MWAWRILIGIATVILSSCSQPARMPEASHLASNFDSKVEISYILGHSHHRFLAQSHADIATAETALDKQVLEKATVNKEKYSDFLKKASAFVKSPKRYPSGEETSCRTPFSITVQVGSETQVMKGCRSSDEGSLSRLVRDGEFLLYSKK